MKKLIIFIVILNYSSLFSQKDSLVLGDKYLEDQIYFGISYNQFFSQPTTVRENGLSYGLSAGYIRDIPLVSTGKIALGLGIGYAFDAMNHGYVIATQNSDVVIEVDPSSSAVSSLKLYNIEFPLEVRWRNSNANKYKFWRIYTGVKLSYNLKNIFEYDTPDKVAAFSNLNRFNKLQYGLTFSAGYSTFNFNMYYGITPILKNSNLGTEFINTKIIKIGLMFYLL